MVRRADDLTADPAVALIEEPTESFDAWLSELLVEPPVDLDTTGAALVAQARADEA
jgi:alpha-D-ribose 1-methylphosphonate 5-triphosphate synthase subunit PhnL